jgi:glycosyltransferase involved in cell wall biosynthesis
MKIALIVPGGVDQSGRERVIPALLWLIERLAHQHSVLVFATRQYSDPCRYSLLGAEVINLGYAASHLPGANRFHHIIKIVHELKTNFVADIVNGFWAGATGLLAVSVGKLLDKPVVVSVAGGEMVWIPEIGYGSQGSILNRYQVNWTLRSADRVTAGSRFLMNFLDEREIRSEWIPLGVDTDLLKDDLERIVGPPYYLIHVGSINQVKNQKLLLEAYQLVRDHGLDAYLDWVGQDTLNGQMQNYAAQLGLQDRVRFHGFLPLEDIIPLYHRAHVFIQTSLYEAQGVAVCEAAAMGVPTVGTDVGIVSEMSPRSAVAVLVNDKNRLAESIVRLLTDNSARHEVAYKAQNWARTYNADWTASSFLKIYAELIHQHPIKI